LCDFLAAVAVAANATAESAHSAQSSSTKLRVFPLT
jgi:hypothetical protein